jgi:biotin carboxyl carrier protein
MIFFIRHQGKEYTVRVESRNQQTWVKFDDEPEQAIDLVYFGNDCTFLQGQRVFHANVVGEKADYTVWRPEGNVGLSVESEYKRIVNLLRGQELGDENNVYAKMPGKISKIMAQVGSKVEKGSPVLVMEAMKMENEIRVAIDGEVTNICVKEGQAVETGALLMELKPNEA